MRALLLYASLPLIVLIGLSRPFWGLLIYVAINVIRPEMLFWGGYTGNILFPVSIGSALLGFLFKGNRLFAPLSLRESWLLFWVWLAVTVSLVFTQIPLNPRAWYYAEELLKLFVVGWLILALVFESERIRQFEDTFLGAASLLALWGCQQHFHGNERLEGLGGYAFGDTNGVAAFGVLLFPLALHKLLTARDRKQRLFGLVSTVLIGLMIVFTQSRGGLLGLGVGVAVLWWLTPKRKTMVIALSLVGLLILPFIGQQYMSRVSTIAVDQEERDLSAGSRLVLWRTGLLIFEDNPLFGVGLLNYDRAKMPYEYALTGKVNQKLLDYSFQPRRVGHSTWICQLLAEGGLFLTVPYLLLILGFFWGARRIRRTRPPDQNTRDLHNLLCGMLAGIFGYCVCLSFVNGLLDIFLPLQILVGMQVIRAIERESGNELPRSAVQS